MVYTNNGYQEQLVRQHVLFIGLRDKYKRALLYVAVFDTYASADAFSCGPDRS